MAAEISKVGTQGALQRGMGVSGHGRGHGLTPGTSGVVHNLPVVS